MLSLLLLTLSLFLVIKSAVYAIRYSTYVSEHMHLSKHLVGFVIVAIISVLPETLISVVSAIEGTPSLGLGTLFGSNVADLTLVFAIILFASNHNIKIQSKILKMNSLYIVTLLIPIIFGLDGEYSRIEGAVLILAGLAFYLHILQNESNTASTTKSREFSWKYIVYLLASLAAMLLGAYFTVHFGVELANSLEVNPILVGLLIVGLGTTLPEMFFSLKAVQKNQDDLALGDLLGTVMTDGTIVVGIMALIQPFTFDKHIVYMTGFCMVSACILLFYLMKSGRVLTKKEGFILLLFYAVFIASEVAIST